MDKKKELIKKAKSSKIEDAKVESEQNEKKGLYILLVILVLIICLGIIWLFTNKNTTITDAKQFENEYEELNDKVNEKTGKEYYKIDVDSENPVVYSSNKEIIELLESGTGVIYFGFPECPWCRNLIPNLIKAAKKAEVPKIYYLNNLSERDTKKLDESGNIITTQEGTDDYYKILELLGKSASIYNGLNDENVKRLYFPTVVFVKNGEVVDTHIGTVESQTDSKIGLTDEQKEELIDILIEKMQNLYVCDEVC